MKLFVIGVLSLAACLFSSCSTGARTIESVARTPQTINRTVNAAPGVAVRSVDTVGRTSAVAGRSYHTAQRTYNDAPATASRTAGTIGRLFDSIFRSFQ